jgi:hypothetical protein
VLISPAEIADRADIDETDLELFGSISPAEACAPKPNDRSDSDDVPFLAIELGLGVRGCAPLIQRQGDHWRPTRVVGFAAHPGLALWERSMVRHGLVSYLDSDLGPRYIFT